LVTLVEGVNRILFDSIYPLKTRVHIKFESTARSNKLNVFFFWTLPFVLGAQLLLCVISQNRSGSAWFLSISAQIYSLNLLSPSCNYSFVPTRAVVRFQTSAFWICGGPSRALEQGFHHGVLRFCPTSAILPMPHTPISFIYYTCFIEIEVASTLNKIPVFINQELCIFLWCFLLCMNLTRNIDYSYRY